MAQSQGRVQKMQVDTERAIATLEGRAASGVDLEQRFQRIQRQLEEVEQIKDAQERDIRTRVLEADLDELRKAASQEEKDLAQAVFGLNVELETMGKEFFVELAEFTPEERAPVAEAETELARAKQQLKNAKDAFFVGRATNKANAAIDAANAKLQKAEQEAKRRMFLRQQQADMEGSLQRYMAVVQRTINLMKQRIEQTTRQIEIVNHRKTEAYQAMEEAAKSLERLDADLSAAEGDLKHQEEVLLGVTAGTEEYVGQEQKISDLRTHVEAIRGDRNTQLVLFQSKQRFTQELDVHERTQMKLRDNETMWMTALRSDTEERIVTFRSRLDAMKMASGQQFTKLLDEVGVAADLHNVEYMAQLGAASDELRMRRIEKHPEILKRTVQAKAAQTEKVQEIRVREAEAIEEFKKTYGIDPMDSSFFHYQKEEGDESAKADKGAGVF